MFLHTNSINSTATVSSDASDLMGSAESDEATPADLPADAWTVARLNDELEQTITSASDRFAQFIVGEIAEIDRYDFGTFFELRDVEHDPVISCLAWSSATATFEHSLEEGTEAVVEATVDFYPDRGDCQLLVSDYWPLGTSERQKRLDQLSEQLAAEGVFSDDQKQSIPSFPSCVGVVTSPSGSAIEDFWAAVSDRSPRTSVKLYGATVQGDDAVSELISGIQYFDEDSTVDTIVITRGGGSDTALWTFNAEPLVRTIAGCSTPTVVAIGHEDDETLAERVADARAMTPTEAGVEVTPSITDELETLAITERRVTTAYQTLVDTRLTDLDRRIETGVDRLQQRIQQQTALRKQAANLEHRVEIAYQTLIEQRLETVEARIEDGVQDIELAARDDVATARAARGRLADLEARIETAYQTHIDRELDDLDQQITDAYREVETSERVAAGTAAARRLRVIVALLIGLLVLTGAVIVLLLV